MKKLKTWTFFNEAAKTIANTILVHQNKVFGPNAASTINALTINICGSKWRKENTRVAGAKREQEALQGLGFMHFNVTWLRERKSLLNDEKNFQKSSAFWK